MWGGGGGGGGGGVCSGVARGVLHLKCLFQVWIQWGICSILIVILLFLKILVGSHKCGRIDHVLVGEQVGADPERVTQVMKFCPLLEVEVDPGDCLFFHCNLLHKT